jgi:hypothetical protein
MVDRWIEELGYREVPGALLSSVDSIPPDHPFETEVRAMFLTNAVGASAVLCIDRVPTVCLVDATRLEGCNEDQAAQVRWFCEKLWNQNLARIVLVAGDQILEAWSVDHPKGLRESIPAGDSAAIRDFSLYGLLSGEVLRKRADWFDPDKRVDKTLLDDIGLLVESLSEHIPASIAREITASVIFVAYLEDRFIITDAYRKSRKVSALDSLLKAADAIGIERLFNHLQKDFNGDFLASEIHEEGIWQALSDTAFNDLYQFLQRTVLRSGQRDFWRYDFAQIPIELIAGIYETFLGQKADADTPNGNGASMKRAQGAYYTPRLLADWVVEQAFEGGNPLEQRVFDGACGSGMLLTAAFRRLMRAQRSQARTEEGSESANNFAKRCSLLLGHIFGSDIDEDARRLTAFSLYLALLSDLTPRDLELLRQGGHKLPPLKDNIRSKEYGDFFTEKSETANKNRFTIFLSNPPWRELAPADRQTAVVEAWAKRQPQTVHWPKRQIAAAFALAAGDTLQASGRVALILPVGLFTSAEQGARRFRANLLTRYKINRITNFADMRRLIFVHAIHPFVVMIATRRTDVPCELSTEEFEYWTPKADISLSLGRLALLGADRTVMRVTALIDETPQLSLRYWGTQQDVALLERLRQYGTVDDLREGFGWKKGKGFHLVDNDRRVPDRAFATAG